jgi:hypothetical protein
MSLIQNHLQSLAYFIFPTLSIKIKVIWAEYFNTMTE